MEIQESRDDTISEKLISILSLLKIYALRLTGDAVRADDLLQETSIKVLSNAHYFIYNSNFKGWASTIMYNIFSGERARSARSIAVADDSLFNGEYNDVSVNVQEIVDAIEALPVEHRVAFSMFVDGYKYYEIAEELDIPIGTVKSRIHTARAKLQELFKDYVK